MLVSYKRFETVVLEGVLNIKGSKLLSQHLSAVTNNLCPKYSSTAIILYHTRYAVVLVIDNNRKVLALSSAFAVLTIERLQTVDLRPPWKDTGIDNYGIPVRLCVCGIQHRTRVPVSAFTALKLD